MAEKDARDKPDDGLTDLAREIDEASRKADLQSFDADASRVDRVINKVVEVAGVSVLVTIVLIIFSNAVGRYAFNTTLIWGDELVLSLLPWLGMLGMFLSIRRRQVIRIDFFISLMPKALHRIFEVLGSAFASAAFLYLAIISVQYLQLFGTDQTIYLQIQKGWFMSAMVIGPVLAAVAYCLLVVQDMFGKRKNDNS